MRLFICYARVDKPYCLQIVNTLGVHEVWFDERLYAGQQWWRTILQHLEWCDALIYLLSPDSVGSEYCRKEYSIAMGLGKHIFPVLIHEQTPVPSELRDYQYADLSKGLTYDAVAALLNSIHLVERNIGVPAPVHGLVGGTTIDPKPPTANPATVIADAALALENSEFDRAVFLLRQAIERGISSKFIDLPALLREAEAELARQAFLRGAEREYKQIAALFKHERTRKLGSEAFQAFAKAYPGYDPMKLAAISESEKISKPPVPDFSLPLLEWCNIPGGMVTLEASSKNGSGRWHSFYVENFKITKYPVTNAQYQAFLSDPAGYADARWWDFSDFALEWRMKNPQPQPPRFKGDDRPREMVTWFEALAYCRWMSAKTGQNICLPSEQQWQRAAQGDDNRLFPWGNNFDANRCNTKESHLRMTTSVGKYGKGISPYGVYDLAGNVWEWCLNSEEKGQAEFDVTVDARRVVHGGSFVGDANRAQAHFRFFLSPNYLYATIGFRLVCNS